MTNVNNGTVGFAGSCFVMIEKPYHAVILVVEDEPFVRMIAVDVLTGHGMVVLEADCVEEALAVLETESQIDLLFTDINMPGDLDGLDLAAIVHQRRPKMKLIVTSGGNRLSDNDLPDHGVFLSKPYDTYALPHLIEAKLTAAR
jgi:CheY-like chemotaxis protein